MSNGKLLKKTAMTLTELVIAAILIGVVMVGVVSVDYAIRSAKMSAFKEQGVNMNLQRAMMDLTKDARAVTGDILDIGVVEDIVGPDIGICFRHDVSDPNSYSDDKWNCYTHDASNEVYKCTELNNPITDHCTNHPESAYLGFVVQLSASAFYNVVYDGGSPSRLEYIKFTLTAREDTTQQANPITNPEHTLKTRVSPPALSR